jgi:hypothetical protein
MGFDLSSLLDNANKVSKFGTNSQENGGGYRYLYPSIGTLKVKLLYNPKSNAFGRITKKHVIDKSKAICLAMYNQECPVCKAIDNIKNATGQDMWKFNARTRAITFAQYIGANGYTWTKENPEPKVGEIVILMYPWSVYQDINRLLVSCGSHAEELIATNKGKVLNILRWQEGGMTKYKCEIDAFAPEYQSCESEEAFVKMLNDLPNLEDLNCPAAMTDEILKNTNEVAEAVTREYLKPQNSAPVQASNMFNQPASPASSPAPVQSAGNSFPCVGNYDPNNPKCMACLKSVSCKLFTDSTPF